jgi:hypothetical protein
VHFDRHLRGKLNDARAVQEVVAEQEVDSTSPRTRGIRERIQDNLAFVLREEGDLVADNNVANSQIHLRKPRDGRSSSNEDNVAHVAKVPQSLLSGAER